MRSTQQAVRVNSTQVVQYPALYHDRQRTEPLPVDAGDSTVVGCQVLNDHLPSGLEQSWLASLVHSSPDLIGTVSFDGQWLFINQAGQSLLGLHGFELAHKITLLETIAESDQDYFNIDVLPTAMQHGRWQGQLHFKHAVTGSTIVVNSQWFVVRDLYTNQPLCFATISQPEAESLGAESVSPTPDCASTELQNALMHERKLNQLKSCFLADVAHELRSPLTVIASSANLLEAMSDPLKLGVDRLNDAKKQKHFQRIQNKVNQMTQLLEDLLLLSRTEQEQFALQPVRTDVIQFCTELVEEVQMSTDQHQIMFSSYYGEQKYIQQFNAEIDITLLQRILVNLLSNSIKYSPSRTKIYVDLNCQCNTIVFQIRDEGIGIPLEDQQHLFSSFYRASNVESIPGAGLGLAIVKKCVELHNGLIQFHSQVGAGTTFVVSLPIY